MTHPEMTKEQSQSILIPFLRQQLNLAAYYIRSYILDTIPYCGKACMLRFADACKLADNTASAPDRFTKRYQLLLDLEGYTTPYLNYLNNSGEHDPHWLQKMRQTVAELWAHDHPNVPRDQILWLPTETDRTASNHKTPPNICPICGAPRKWEICDVCEGEGYIDAHNVNPLRYNPGDVKMCCDQCRGIGGWYVACPNYHNHPPAPTEKDRTASDPAGGTPAGTPATPLAACQQHRQRKEAV